MYEIQMISSYEKSKGRTLHAEELSALSFWLTQDTERAGFLETSGMRSLMHGLRFTNIKNWKDFRKEFEFTIPRGESIDWANKEVFRFDLMRSIFLERGL